MYLFDVVLDEQVWPWLHWGPRQSADDERNGFESWMAVRTRRRFIYGC